MSDMDRLCGDCGHTKGWHFGRAGECKKDKCECCVFVPYATSRKLAPEALAKLEWTRYSDYKMEDKSVAEEDAAWYRGRGMSAEVRETGDNVWPIGLYILKDEAFKKYSEGYKGNPHKNGGKSECTCGHTGDGSGSQHYDTGQPGHGKCRLCKCPQFTWARGIAGYRRPIITAATNEELIALGFNPYDGFESMATAMEYAQQALDSGDALYARIRDGGVGRLRYTVYYKGSTFGGKARGNPRKRITSDQVFQNITSVPFYDNLIKNPDYFKEAKGLVGEIVHLTPDGYIANVAEMQGTTVERQWELISDNIVGKLEKIVHSGKKLFMPYLAYDTNSQEGRHRAALAKKLGLVVMPVLIVKNFIPEIKPKESNNPPAQALQVVGQECTMIVTDEQTYKKPMGRLIGNPDGSFLIEGTFPKIRGRLQMIEYIAVGKARAEKLGDAIKPWQHDFSSEQINLESTPDGLRVSCKDKRLWEMC